VPEKAPNRTKKPGDLHFDDFRRLSWTIMRQKGSVALHFEAWHFFVGIKQSEILIYCFVL
jgi:hypothetical protein